MDDINLIKNEEKMNDYDDFCSQLLEDSETVTFYLYKKEENSAHYAFLRKYTDMYPDIQMVADKYRVGAYKVVISSKKAGKVTDRYSRSFIISEFYNEPQNVVNRNSDNTEMMKLLLPYIAKNDNKYMTQGLQEIMKQNIMNYSGLLKDMRKNIMQPQQQEYEEETEGYDEEESGDNSMNMIYSIIETYIPNLLGDSAGTIKTMMSNSIVRPLIMGIFKENKKFQEISEWLSEKIGEEQTANIIRLIGENNK